MVSRKLQKEIRNYLKEIGQDNKINELVINELINVESDILEFRKYMDEHGRLNAKGRLNGAFIGYNASLNKKTLLLQKLAATVSDKDKLKGDRKEPVQSEIDWFMKKVS
jgi:DNA integrity scanning protein DisA with diadenylate cyclase activity